MGTGRASTAEVVDTLMWILLDEHLVSNVLRQHLNDLGVSPTERDAVLRMKPDLAAALLLGRDPRIDPGVAVWYGSDLTIGD